MHATTTTTTTTGQSRQVKTLLDTRIRLYNAMITLGVTPERITKLNLINEKLIELEAIPGIEL